jgi:AbrB family looped-hinge helix DNA binding protein
MSKVTSKLQVTIPKTVAEAHGIRPGSDVHFQSAGDVIRVTTTAPAAGAQELVQDRLAAFDAATERQRVRNEAFRRRRAGRAAARGWKREDLYDRGIPH